MPLARIRTQLSSVPPELQRRLAASGYEVEIAAPAETRSRHADLEITVESRPVRECLAEASQFDRNAYIAPGSLPLPSVPELSQSDREDRQRIEREHQRLQEEADRKTQQKAEELQLQLESEQRERLRQEQLKREAELQEQRRQSELLRVESETRRTAELKEAHEHESRIRAEEQRRFQAEQKRMRVEGERLRSELARREEELRERERQWQAERQRLERAREHERAEREHLEREHRATMASTPADLPSNVVPITSPAAPEPNPADKARQQLSQLKSTVVRGGARRLRHKEYRRAALTAAGLTAVIMFLWIALSTRRPADPLTTPDLVKSNQVQQTTPFGSATIAAPVQVHQQPVATPSTPIKPAPQKATAKPSPAKKAAVSRKPGRYQNDQEVVVRHFGPKTTNASNAKVSKDGVKIISDAD